MLYACSNLQSISVKKFSLEIKTCSIGLKYFVLGEGGCFVCGNCEVFQMPSMESELLSNVHCGKHVEENLLMYDSLSV